MRTQIELSNVVAAELAGSQDVVLRALEAHLDCKVFLRGNLLTFDGEEEETIAGERVVNELAELITRGHQIGPGTITAVTGALDAHESPGRLSPTSSVANAHPCLTISMPCKGRSRTKA